MASSSLLAEDSSLEERLGDEILIPHDPAHYTYTLGPICTERPLYSHITESFILPDGFTLPIAK